MLFVRLHADEDFKELLKHLTESRNTKLMTLEDATSEVQTHKLQGYCQALRDLIELCSRK
jgi:hypothetical protein